MDIEIKNLPQITLNDNDLAVVSQEGLMRSATIKKLRGVINSLDTGGTTVPLSAEQGKIIASQIKNINFPVTYNKPIITIVDDDGKSEFLTRVQPVYDAKGIKATLGIITDKVGTDGYMTLTELTTLYNAGYELVSHSKTHSETYFHSDIANTDDSVYETEFSYSKQWFADNGFGTIETVVYPYSNYGDDSVRIKNVAKKYYKNGINADGQYNSCPNDSIYLNRYFIDISNFTISQIESTIDEAISNNAWLILGIHSWSTTQNTPETLATIIDYIQAKSVDILTVKEALKYKSNILSIGEFTDIAKGIFVGKDGSILNKSEKTKIITTDYTITTDSAITAFEEGKFTIVQIPLENDTLTGTGGIMMVYRNTYYSYGIFITNHGKSVYLRMWDDSNSIWLSWINLTEQALNIVHGTYTGTMDDAITKYGQYKETIVQLSSTTDTFKSSGGVMKVFRGDLYYSYALFYPISEFKIYKRLWDETNSVWGTWTAISV